MADEQKRQKLKRAIAELASHRGRHTELVSVYVPAGYDLNKIIGHLQQEQGTAENIKSASTRKNVISALERMIQHLKLFTKTPENGIVAFSGNVAEREGQLDVRVWSLEPPIPLNIRIYRCDKEFVLDPLKEMLEEKKSMSDKIVAYAHLKGYIQENGAISNSDAADLSLHYAGKLSRDVTETMSKLEKMRGV